MSTPRLHGKKVLIVDDDEDILSSIELAMRAEGANTRTVTDGNAALAAFDEGDPDAVVLDMMLPKRSGFLVLEHLKKLGNPPVVVMITANMGKRHMAYAQDLGVDAYLVKPVPVNDGIGAGGHGAHIHIELVIHPPGIHQQAQVVLVATMLVY